MTDPTIDRANRKLALARPSLRLSRRSGELVAAHRVVLLLGVIMSHAVASPPTKQPSVFTAPAPVDFNREIRPILAGRCGSCHGGVHRRGGLSFLFREEALRPGDSGIAAIVPSAPDESHLIHRVTSDSDPMPPSGDRLSPEEVDALRRWISEGAHWADHWSYVPPDETVSPPRVEGSWGRNGIDAFVQDALLGGRPADEASREEWLRRAALDLTGLPPTLEEQNAFLKDRSDVAYERQVDRLLSSPHFGERFAVMWLDLARYADSKGYEKDGNRTIWPYRDWVIDAFNNDLPFDEFTVRQLAGDMLENPTTDMVLATAFHRNTMNNDEGGTDDEEFRIAAVIDRVNTTYDVWMGTTMGCAQCHNHPYEPFTQVDYYRSIALFNQTEDADRPDERPVLAVASGPSANSQIQVLNDEVESLRREAEVLEAGWVAPKFGRAPTSVVGAHATGGTNLSVVAGGDLRASGLKPTTNEYRVDLEAADEPITALRLDVSPDESFATGGVGRGKDGNFVLSDLRLSVVRPDASASHRARYVRIDLPGSDRILHVAEVQVFGPGGVNHAIAGAATQSSTGYGGPAARAIDGNTDGEFPHGSVSHTADGVNPWWELDLGGPRPIDRVVIWNRTDGDGQIQDRMRGARLSVLDAERQLIWHETLASPPRPSAIVSLDPRERSVPIFQASQSFAQQGFGVGQVLWNEDIDRRGWAVAPNHGEAQHAIFRLERSADVPPDGFLRVRLAHWYTNGGQYDGAAIGRFSLSLSSDAGWLPPGGAGEWLENQSRSRQALAELESIPTVAVPIQREKAADARRATRILIRGNFLDQGDEVDADIPRSLGRDRGVSTIQDRLQFARWLVSPENPMTARVIVNRFWEQLFGLGLVETLEDFGTQGEPPSHKALLDWLAVRFRRDLHWSVKSLLREIVLSATYRQDHRRGASDNDPRNRQLARGPRNRLTAEQIRDHALAASGLFSPKMYGPGVMPPQPDGVWQTVYNGSVWKTADGEDRYRRALYTFWRRTAPYPSMVTFDAPSREFCVSRRISTNTPLQALVVMNDPVYVECASALARQMVSASDDESERLVDGFRRATCRTPTGAEIALLRDLLEDARRDFESRPEDAVTFAGEPELAAWCVVASVLLNLDEALTR